jgi:hypothetical protein
MGANAIRGVVIAVGALLVVAGLLGVVAGPATAIAGIWGVVVGAVAIAAALLERSRYRSSHAELSSEGPGPGGGEPTDRPMDPRFRRTDERFIDPTSNVSMRVWIDPESGERRYRAEE